MEKKHLFLMFVALFIVGSVIGYFCVPYGVDWLEIFQPVSRRMMSNDLYDPYVGTGFANPSYTFFVTIPFALLPVDIGRAAWFGFNFACLVVFAYMAGFEIPAIMVFMCTPPVFSTLWDGNIDGLVLLGFVLPPWIGIPLLMIKPQIGFVVVALYAFNALFRERDYRLFAQQFGPYFFLVACTLLTYHNWIPSMRAIAGVAGWNISLGPIGLFSALILCIFAFSENEKDLALPAGVLISPYVSINSFVVFPILFKKNWLVMAVITFVAWVTLLPN